MVLAVYGAYSKWTFSMGVQKLLLFLYFCCFLEGVLRIVVILLGCCWGGSCILSWRFLYLSYLFVDSFHDEFSFYRCVSYLLFGIVDCPKNFILCVFYI